MTAPVNKLIDKIVTGFKPRPKIKVSRPSNRSSSRPETDMEYRARKKKENDEIDSILDKIKKSGYTSLSAEEKKRLFEAGKNNVVMKHVVKVILLLLNLLWGLLLVIGSYSAYFPPA